MAGKAPTPKATTGDGTIPENPERDVPGPSDIPTTNLLMAGIVMKAGSYLVTNFVQKRLLKGRYGVEDADAIIQSRGLKHKAASIVAAKVATKSVPGALVIGGALAAKTLFDRGGKRRKAKREADRKLLKQAHSD
ncbi:hypothetical protein [Pontixanthobacter aquaemixtae]|uniref:Uncharacterized protein n=1 Tax=Pontixanthobacter aquaemixtae TaxID=1958940 RepID=A0A844ZYB4_9SPHN|nr:hypothetical protein [Pontixanthobacter aquaemixtae]MXO91926.1 hypothetical protein [Pontixanthobacter aquaemixtae]